MNTRRIPNFNRESGNKRRLEPQNGQNVYILFSTLIRTSNLALKRGGGKGGERRVELPSVRKTLESELSCYSRTLPGEVIVMDRSSRLGGCWSYLQIKREREGKKAKLVARISTIIATVIIITRGGVRGSVKRWKYIPNPTHSHLNKPSTFYKLLLHYWQFQAHYF